MSAREKNLQTQFVLVNQEGDNFFAQLQESDPNKWIVTLRGPKDSPYETGKFKLHISFPDDFPFAAPVINFRTKIYHPNIDNNSGTIAWSLTKEEWSPAWYMDKILIMLGSLLKEPDPRPECEIAPEVGHEWRERRDVYWQTAKEWTEKYAK